MAIDAMAKGLPPAIGLSSDEAAARLRADGPNALPEPAHRLWVALARRFWGVVPWMLEGAILIDLWLQRWLEAAVIAVLLLFQAVMGTLQEQRAHRAAQLLRSRVVVEARVRRDGYWQRMPARDLVAGDAVALRAGDIVPADVRLVRGALSVDLSSLTGESLPVDEAAGAELPAAAVVRHGEAVAEVTATGARTRNGRLASLLAQTQAPGRLQTLAVQTARMLLGFDVLLIGVVLAAATVHGHLGVGMLPFVLMLLVASVPVALPAMSTLSATLGAARLAEQGVLVTRLAALDAAAAMGVLCLDKTGTVTENRLVVTALQPAPGTDEATLLQRAVWASDEATQDPIDLALLASARERGVPLQAERLAYTAFDPETKHAMAEVRDANGRLRVLKGEPLSVARLVGADAEATARLVEALAADGERVLAVGSVRDGAARLDGLIAFADPLRSDSAALVQALRQQGVRVVLVTGDGEATARAVARRLGLEGEVATAGAVAADAPPQQLARFGVYARVLPEDKLRLVQAWQRAGAVVGMTGDGVNDAPALAQADVGIAVAGATDVARASAGMLLTRPGLADIQTAIRVSRTMRQRMQSWMLAMISRKTGVPGFLALGVVVFGGFVIDPLLMVLFMLAGDLSTFALSGDRVTPSPRPDPWRMRPLAVTGVVLGLVLLVSSLGVHHAVVTAWQLDERQAHTASFVWLTFAAGQSVLYAVRHRGWCWQRPWPGRSLVTATAVGIVTAGLFATLGWLMAPIPLSATAALLVAALVLLLVLDTAKRLSHGAVNA